MPADEILTDVKMEALSTRYENVLPPPGLKVNLGDEVQYRGQRWLLDDERLKGLEGQGDLRYEDLDLKELEPADWSRDVFVDETGELEVHLEVRQGPEDRTFLVGETVPIPDGIYVGEEGAVIVHDGRVTKVTSHLHGRWGGRRGHRRRSAAGDRCRNASSPPR